MLKKVNNSQTAITGENLSAYSPTEIEDKWRAKWNKSEIYKTPDSAPGKRNWFALTMFPYPSGDVHVGHWYAFAPADAHARFKRMEGFNVVQPQGFDAFGLPAENAAITNKIHPREWTLSNIANMRRQFRIMGNSYDWSRELATCEPEYYKWNQRFFLDFLKQGLAYRAEAAANWCPSCQTTLANEQVKEGMCERCSSLVLKKNLRQWFFKITNYAEELLQMEDLDWPEKIKTMQRNWIGRSEGVNVRFGIETDNDVSLPKEIATFTTRIDTIYGTTFIALAPENPLALEVTSPERKAEVADYIEKAQMTSDIERSAANKKKTGVVTGASAVNPANGERIPILVADYVLMTYGSGAVMGVPAHDQRDFDFAKKYGLPIPVVVVPPSWNGSELTEAYTGKDGVMTNSEEFNGISASEAIERIADKAEKEGWGERTVTYRIRDWLISRQRYWGTPIPVVYCKNCGTDEAPEIVPVNDEDLPVLLPEKAEFLPTGESPLKLDRSFTETTCPKCGCPAERETDTMDTFMDSSWYHLRYTSPGVSEKPFDKAKVDQWMPVNQYMGGAEHAVMHLLYSRFFNKALRDIGYLDFDEPYARLFNQGLLIKENKKISKRSNPLPPEPVVKKYGVDAFRCYLMFLGPWEQGGNWSDKGIVGVTRWLSRVWGCVPMVEGDDADATTVIGGTTAKNDKDMARLCHSTTKRVVKDMRDFKFNTVIAALMEMTTGVIRLYNQGVSAKVYNESLDRLIKHLAPLAPHLAEELWERRGHSESVHLQSTPQWDEDLTTSDTVTVIVQVNGKVRDRLALPAGVSEDEALSAAKASRNAARFFSPDKIVHSVYVPDKLVNLVVRN